MPSASEPAPSRRPSDLIQGAPRPRTIVFTLNPRHKLPPQNSTVLTLRKLGTSLLCSDISHISDSRIAAMLEILETGAQL